MNIVLSEADFAALSKGTQMEILRHLCGDGLMITDAKTSHGKTGPAELGFDMLSRFMGGLSPVTRRCLEVFALNDGKATMDQLTSAGGYEAPKELSGVRAGITRRVRQMLSNPHAQLLGWRTTSDKDWGGYFYVSGVTHQSLVRYFR